MVNTPARRQNQVGPGAGAAVSGHRQLDCLQAVRGLAAIMVMLYHTGTMYAVHTQQVLWGNVFRAGFAGVDVFFVLSGMVIVWVHASDIGRPERAARFVVKRALRLFPVYWAVVLLKLLKSPDTVSGLTLLLALTLFPVNPPFINVSWTLTFELLFYGVFALFIVLPRRPWTVGLAVVAALMPLWPYPTAVDSVAAESLLNVVHSWHLFEFLFGASVAWGVRRLARLPIGLALALAFTGMAAFCSFAVLGTQLSMANWQPGTSSAYQIAELQGNAVLDRAVFAFGLPAAALIAGVAAAELKGVNVVPGRRLLGWVGTVSYSLYLVHGFVIHVLFSQPWLMDLLQRHPAALIVPWMLALAVAWVFHVSIERPAMRLGQRFGGIPSRAMA